MSPKSTSGEQLDTESPQPTHLQERKPISSKSGWRSFTWRQLSSLLFQGQRSLSDQRLPQAGSAAARGTESHPNRCRPPHPPPGPASRPARDRGPRGIPASLCGRRASRRRPAGVEFPRAPGILGSSATPRGPGFPNGESRMRARARWGRRPRGEGRVQSPAGRGAPRLRRMRREGAQSRTRLAATGWGEQSPDGESAKEIWPPPRARSRERTNSTRRNFKRHC